MEVDVSKLFSKDRLGQCEFELVKCNAKYHKLKILPKWFALVKSGEKSFEIRKDDRDYQIGDFLLLGEWDGDYTGDAIILTIRTIIKHYDFPEEIQPGYCILGL